MENLADALTKLMDKRKANDSYRKLILHAYHDADVQKFLEDNSDSLTADAIERGAAKLYEFVSEKEKYLNGEPMNIPGYKPTLVVTNHLIDLSYQPTAQLLADHANRQLQQRVKSINIPKNIRGATLKGFEQDGGRFMALSAVLDFIDSYSKSVSDFHQGLYLSGAFGIGKTYLLGALANELAARGLHSTMVHFPSFAVEMKKAIGNNSTGDKVDSIKRAPVLVLDDIGADASSTWIRDDVLAVILEYRMQEELPTFFTSNFTMQELQDGYLTYSNKGESEPLKAQRIMQRIRFLAKEIPMNGENRRLKS